MIDRKIIFLALSVHAHNTLCAAEGCATELLRLSVSHMQSPQDPQKARSVIDLLDNKCPTSSPKKLKQLAERAATQVPHYYYGWWHVCTTDVNNEPKCRRYGAYVQAAEQLLYNSDNFFVKIRKIAQ